MVATITERDELLDLLLRHGILHRSETQPVLSRDGSSHRWMLDSLSVTLTPRGAELAGRLMLEKLRLFDGRQIATFGLTAIPILQSAVLQSAGVYNGLVIRKEQKAHGSQKWIEGRMDRDEPTIVIDDSIASGMSVTEGIEKLEQAGLRVEGCISLVRFGWEGGVSELAGRGYHVESIYDIFEDFMSRMDGEEGPDYNPTRHFPDLRWSGRRAPEGLHPAQLAREVLREFAFSGEVLRPPMRLDRDDYDSSGGAWVSLRSRSDLFERHARDGFWHFPREHSWGAAEDVVRAAFRTALDIPDGRLITLLEESAIAVTFFGALRPATVGELDNDRYGIVVVSSERPEVMGGALPRMPGIRDEWQQFRHARYNNAKLLPHEPYTIYRHEVAKYVEPCAEWTLSGAPAHDESPDFGVLAARAREIALGMKNGEPLPPVELPPTASQLFVTIYIDGEVRGCMGSEIGDLNEDIRELTECAMADERFEHRELEPDTEVAVCVTVLFNELEMGDFSREEVRIRYQHGKQALMVDQGNREGMLLPCVAAWLNLDAEDFVDEVLDKAGVTRPPYNWRRFDCCSWLADKNSVSRMEGAFPRGSNSPLPALEMARLHLDYLLRSRLPDGSLYFSYYPFPNTLYQGIDAARLAHAAWTFARAGQMEATEAALSNVLRQPEDPSLALARDAFVLLTLCVPDMPQIADRTAITARLWESIDRHGRVSTWTPPPLDPAAERGGAGSFACPSAGETAGATKEAQEEVDPDELQNYTPGQVLLALAAAAEAGVAAPRDGKLLRAFLYYRHRFRYKRDFGQVSWMAQAFAAWHRHARDQRFADFVFEVTDWILQFQNQESGAFLTDHQPDTPGYTTAVYLEAVAAAAITASDQQEHGRSIRYTQAFSRGLAFLNRLTIQEHDASVLPNAEFALGGLRENLYSSHIRADFVQHSLAAILELYPNTFVRKSIGESEWQRK